MVLRDICSQHLLSTATGMLTRNEPQTSRKLTPALEVTVVWHAGQHGAGSQSTATAMACDARPSIRPTTARRPADLSGQASVMSRFLEFVGDTGANDPRIDVDAAPDRPGVELHLGVEQQLLHVDI